MSEEFFPCICGHIKQEHYLDKGMISLNSPCWHDWRIDKDQEITRAGCNCNEFKADNFQFIQQVQKERETKNGS